MSNISSPKTQIVPKIFFKTHRKSGYSNWRFAFWRELFQNSVDAGAKRIDIGLTQQEAIGTFGRTPEPHNVTRVTFKDDGSGITRDVFDNVFFAIGRSTKTSEDMTGGFGTARVMLCCSQDRYEVHSNGLYVEGDGIEYDIRDAEPGSPEYIKKGCRFVIDIDLNDGEHIVPDVSRMEQELMSYISMSQIPAQIYVNGERWSARTLKGPARRVLYADGEAFATAHISGGKLANPGYIIIRQNGSAMFYRHSSALARDGKQVIVEVDPKFGRLVMTDNRSMFKEGYDSAFNNMMNSIIANPTSSMNNAKTEKVLALSGGLGMIRVSRRMRPGVNTSYRDDEGEAHETESYKIDNQAEMPDGRVVRAPSGQEAIRGVMAPAAEDRAPEREHTQCPNVPNMFIRVKDVSGYKKMSAAIPRYMPKSWGVSNPENGRSGIKPHQLLFAWASACRTAVEALQTISSKSDLDSIGIVPGFLFSKPDLSYGNIEYDEAMTLATCEKIKGHNAYILLLNPLHTSGRCRYAISSFNDPRPMDPDAPVGMKRLIAIAAHEVAHIIESDHNEVFASALTGIMSIVDQRDAWRNMQSAMSTASSYYESLRDNCEINKANRQDEATPYAMCG